MFHWNIEMLNWWLPGCKGNSTRRSRKFCQGVLTTLYSHQRISQKAVWSVPIKVKPVLSGHSKIDKTELLMTNGSLMKVESIAGEISAILLPCIKRYLVSKNNLKYF